VDYFSEPDQTGCGEDLRRIVGVVLVATALGGWLIVARIPRSLLNTLTPEGSTDAL
jgi:hypothetical protein